MFLGTLGTYTYRYFEEILFGFEWKVHDELEKNIQNRQRKLQQQYL